MGRHTSHTQIKQNFDVNYIFQRLLEFHKGEEQQFKALVN